MQQKTCCFVGERNLQVKKIETTIKRLNEEIEKLIHQGVTDFISCGALGFDAIAATLVIAKKQAGYQVKLILALPCIGHNNYWTSEQIKLYEYIKSEADEIFYISEEFSHDYIKNRNRFMINHSTCCISYLTQNKGSAFRTISYARKNGIKVIDLTR